MKLTNASSIPVYTISGSSTARPLPEWLARKRKRSLKQDPEFANRIELLQDFEFEEASSCIRISDDNEWVVSTGTYKPQMHVHYLPHLALSFSRHTNTLNQTFELLSSDCSKSIHLQQDRALEFHTLQGCHYATRLPRYGRDLKYDRRSAEALVPAVGINESGTGDVYRLNLEVGRFMRSYEVDVGGDDLTSAGAGSLQGGIAAGAVNTAAVGEQSHNLLAFGTSLGTVEFWDPRSKDRVGLLPAPPSLDSFDARQEITCLELHPSGLTLATGSSAGIVHLYDLRSPVPLLKKDQGYGYPIKNLTFLTASTSSARTAHLESEPKILSADKRIIKIWDARDASPWTSVEPAVDLNCVTWNKDSGMILTANEGRQQHSFFIPQLGPAPKWCSFLDNLVEEMAEDHDDPAAFAGGTRKVGEVYDNFKFLTVPQLRTLNLDHLVGTTGLLRPYMHGYFVAQQLYEEARLISNPEIWQEARQQSIREKIAKERESRIRGSKKSAAKVNRRLANRILEREEKNERRKARRAIAQGKEIEEAATSEPAAPPADADEAKKERETVLSDPRFAALFADEAFAIDETSNEYRALNASTESREQERSANPNARFTAAELEDLESRRRGSSSSSGGSSDNNEDDDDQGPGQRRDRTSAIAATSSVDAYRRSKKTGRHAPRAREPAMHVTASNAAAQTVDAGRDRTFGERAAVAPAQDRRAGYGPSGRGKRGDVVGEREVTFTVQPKKKTKAMKQREEGEQYPSRQDDGAQVKRAAKDRRSASNNVFRRM